MQFNELSFDEKKRYVTGLYQSYPDGAKLKELKKTIGSVDKIVAVLSWIRNYAEGENIRHGDDIASLPGLWIGDEDFIANGYFSNEDGSLCFRGYSGMLGHDIYRVVSVSDTISFNS